MEIVYATVSNCVQIGIDKYQQEYRTKSFPISVPLEEILTWARIYIPKATINDIVFSSEG